MAVHLPVKSNGKLAVYAIYCCEMAVSNGLADEVVLKREIGGMAWPVEATRPRPRPASADFSPDMFRSPFVAISIVDTRCGGGWICRYHSITEPS